LPASTLERIWHLLLREGTTMTTATLTKTNTLTRDAVIQQLE